MEPVNPDRDGCPDYKYKIKNPMDLSSILNKLYLDPYKTSESFWIDLGFVVKNCRKYNRNPDSDIRLLGDTLREVKKIFLRSNFGAF